MDQLTVHRARDFYAYFDPMAILLNGSVVGSLEPDEDILIEVSTDVFSIQARLGKVTASQEFWITTKDSLPCRMTFRARKSFADPVGRIDLRM
jgi:hypothetical protein